MRPVDYNHVGHVISITDADKQEAAYYEYDAWGNTMTEAGTWRSPYCFSTKERDYGIKDGEYEYKTGLLYFGARYYIAKAGRWTQRDPLEQSGADCLYAFVFNSPANSIDPLGFQVQPAFPAAPDPRPKVPDRGDWLACFKEALGENWVNELKGIADFANKRKACKIFEVFCNDDYQFPDEGPESGKWAGTLSSFYGEPVRFHVVEKSKFKEKFLNCLLKTAAGPVLGKLIPDVRAPEAKLMAQGALKYRCSGKYELKWSFRVHFKVVVRGQEIVIPARTGVTGTCCNSSMGGCCNQPGSPFY